MDIVNWKIITAWQNWLLVAFSAIILIFVAHLFMRNNVNMYGAYT